MVNLKREDNENELQFIWRLASAKDAGILDMDWEQLASVFNKELREEDEEYSSSAYRKKYQMAKAFKDAGVFDSDDEYLKQLRQLKEEAFKERRKLLDQRREYNKLYISDARAEHLDECLIEAASNLNKEKPLGCEEKFFKINLHKEALLCWADWHYGMTVDNVWNTYNTTICKQRVKTMVELTKEYLQSNQIDVLTIITCGDAAHGAIHLGCRVQSEEDVCDQLMHVSEIMAEAIDELSKVVNHISVYSCYGNHLRTVQNKKDSIHSDNMEKIVPWWMRQRLKDNSKVEIIESEYKEFTKVNILGSEICAVHGDLEKNFKNIGVTINSLFTKKFGQTIDYTISADKHHLEEFEQFGINSILVPSLCGSDEYANNGRMYSNPGQTLMIFNDVYGRECTYNLPVNLGE